MQIKVIVVLCYVMLRWRVHKILYGNRLVCCCSTVEFYPRFSWWEARQRVFPSKLNWFEGSGESLKNRING